MPKCTLKGDLYNIFRFSRLFIYHVFFILSYLRWLGLRLEATGSLIILFVSLFVIIRKDQMNAGIAGLSLSYAITVIILY